MSRRTLLQKIGGIDTGSFYLDTYDGFISGLALRKLNSNSTGNYLTIRRSSDNAETSIGWDGSGNLDLTALSSFVGANSAYVKEWYIQGPHGGVFSNTNTATQPRIVNAGTNETSNGKIAINFITGHLDCTSFELPFTFMAIGVSELNGSNQFLIERTGVAGMGHFYRRFTTGGVWFRHSGTNASFLSFPAGLTQAQMIFNRYDLTNTDFTLNGTYDSVIAMNNNWSTGATRIGNSNSKIQEISYLEGDRRTDTSGVSSLVNSFYGTF